MKQAIRRAMLLPVLVVALCLAPAAHAVGWVSSGPLSPADRVATDPHIVITPSGERVLASLQENPAVANAHENISVRVAPPGGDFGPTQTFDGQFDEPKLGAGTDGAVGPGLDRTRGAGGSRRTPDPGPNKLYQGAPLVVPGGEDPANLHVAVIGRDVYMSLQSTLLNASSIWVANLAPDNSLQFLPGPPGNLGALAHRDGSAPGQAQ